MSYNWQIGEEIASDKLKITGLAHLTDTGSANTYVANPQVTDGTGTDDAYSALVAGMAFTFIPANTNTGPSTLNINGIGAIDILNQQGEPVSAGDILQDLPVMMIFDGTSFVLLSQNPSPDGYFGDGSDGDVVISSSVSLTRDMFYNNLTIQGSGELIPDGYRIFVKNKLEVESGGVIDMSGGDGGDGQDAPTFAITGGCPVNISGSQLGGDGGAGGSAKGTGTIFGGYAGTAGTDGGNGSRGCNGGQTNGVPSAQSDDGEDSIKAITENDGARGGNGGYGGGYTDGFGNGGTTISGIAGTNSGTILNVPKNKHFALILTDFFPTVVRLSATAGSSGGSGGSAGGHTRANSTTDRSATGGGGGGGGAGGSGGILAIYANTIIINAGGSVISNGGDGGDGGNATDPDGQGSYKCGGSGGGGGGAGGNGGAIILVYSTLVENGTVSVNKGVGGTFGNGTLSIRNGMSGSDPQDGTDGTVGEDGEDGVIIKIKTK